MSVCCDDLNVATKPGWGRRCAEVGAWAFPTVLLALMPKCPACLAAYVAVWTGLGISLSTAGGLRTSLWVLCVLSLLWLLLKRLGRFLGFANVRESVIPGG